MSDEENTDDGGTGRNTVRLTLAHKDEHGDEVACRVVKSFDCAGSWVPLAENLVEAVRRAVSSVDLEPHTFAAMLVVHAFCADTIAQNGPLADEEDALIEVAMNYVAALKKLQETYGSKGNAHG